MAHRPRRPALSADRIVEAAVRVADRGGIGQVSMRNVGRELGVEAMSLYHHLDGKEALLDGLADWFFTRIELPDPTEPWRTAMADRAGSARRALSAHPWALGLVESRRTPGPALLRHHEAVLACLRHNGFPVALASSAFSAIDAYVYGFVLTELNLPFDAAGDRADTDADDDAGGIAAFAEEMHRFLPAEEFPHLVEMLAEQVIGHDYVYADEFAFGLDLVLDGLERHLTGTASASAPDAAPETGGADG